LSVQVVRNIKAEKELEAIFKDVSLKAGYFGGDAGNGETLASIAAENEIARPFMSRAADKMAVEIPNLLITEIKKAGFEAGRFIKLAGLKAVALSFNPCCSGFSVKTGFRCFRHGC